MENQRTSTKQRGLLLVRLILAGALLAGLLLSPATGPAAAGARRLPPSSTWIGKARGAVQALQGSNQTLEGPVLYDTFTGEGALIAHTPDISPAGSAWAIYNGTFNTLSAGYARYSSGTFGRAVIDPGLSDLELESTFTILASPYDYGLILRANSDASDRWLLRATVGSAFMHRWSAGVRVETLLFYGGTLPPLTAGTDSTFLLKALGPMYRLWIDGTYVGLARDPDFMTNTYVGLGTYQGSSAMKWDSITVRPDQGAWSRWSILGDNISSGSSTWPFLAERDPLHQDAYLVANHAVTSHEIVDNMDAQTAAAAADNADVILIALGTYDESSPDATAEYLENLLELHTSNPNATLYAIGVLPKNPTGTRDTVNGWISAAVAQAQAAGVPVTYWNTDGWIDPATDTTNGLQPNTQGQAKIAAQVVAHLP